MRRTFAKKALRQRKRKLSRAVKNLQKKKQLTESERDQLNHFSNIVAGCDAFETLVRKKHSNALKTKRGYQILAAVLHTMKIWDPHGYPQKDELHDIVNLSKRFLMIKWTKQAKTMNHKSWRLHRQARPVLRKLIHLYNNS